MQFLVHNDIFLFLIRTWLYDICRGKCDEQVQNRTIAKSIGCGKNFVGPNKLKTVEEVSYNSY